MWPCLAVVALSLSPGDTLLSPSMGPIRASIKVQKGVYTLADKTGHGAIRIDADDVTVDFQGATLQSPDAAGGRQESYNGIGVAIGMHRNVTIRNARIHGFQFNIKGFGCQGLHLVDCEVSGSRSQRIRDGESVNPIWLDLRGLDAWRTYGAGVWLEKCFNAEVKGLRANQSQNGLVMVVSGQSRIYDCDFSYNSGWGIALCRSSDNLICWNHADFVNRPWAGGWGGDSSGVCETTHCNRNIWAFNSFTHGGDGFFLATTNGGFDDKGKLHEDGTCDGNWIVHNDGSWATANAFESTFSSKNVFYRNIADDSNYGFWLGYSKGNILDENEINGSHADGIATEQGSTCVYIGNDIEKTGESAIHLWGGTDAKFTQSPSVNNFIARNRIIHATRALDLVNSPGLSLHDNVIQDIKIPDGFKETAGKGEDKLTVPRLDEIMSLKPKGFKMYRDTDLPKGWEWLDATDYGMKDYRKMIAPWSMKNSKTVRIMIRPDRVTGFEVPEWMVQFKDTTTKNDWLVTATPRKASFGQYRPFKIVVTDVNGVKSSIEGQVLDLNWHIKWFKWFRNDRSAYTDVAAWDKLFAGPPLKEEDLSDLPDIPSYQSPEPGIPADHFALVATARIRLKPGTYRFDTISDDGIQVLVDGVMVINDWNHHGATQDNGTVKASGDIHTFEVHYCQEDGAAALSFSFSRVPEVH